MIRLKNLGVIIGISVIGFLMIGAWGWSQELLNVRTPDIHDNLVVFQYLDDLWVSNLEGTRLQPLTLTDNIDSNPKFSPDGSWIAFSRNYAGATDVYRIPIQGGEAIRITYRSSGEHVLDWSQDSKQIYVASASKAYPFHPRLYAISFQTGIASPLPSDLGTHLSFSPDEAYMVYNRFRYRWYRKGYHGHAAPDVWLYTKADNSYKRLTPDYDGMDSYPLWASNDRIYFVSDRDGEQNIYWTDVQGRQPIQVTHFEQGRILSPSLSTNRERIAFEHLHKLWYLDVETEEVHPIPLNHYVARTIELPSYQNLNGKADSYSIAPTSQRVAYTFRGELFTTPLEEGDTRQLTHNYLREKYARWSPNGAYIAYVSDPEGQEDVFLTDPVGFESVRQLTDRDSLIYNITWAPDSSFLVIQESDGNLYRIDIDTGEECLIYTSPFGGEGWAVGWMGMLVEDVQISPDGKWILITEPVSPSNWDIFLMSSDGGDLIPLTDDPAEDHGARFGHDGTYITFISNRRGVAGLYQLPLVPVTEDPTDPELDVREAEQTYYEQVEQAKKDEESSETDEDESESEDPPTTEAEEEAEGPYAPFDLTNLKSRLRLVKEIPGHHILHATPFPDKPAVAFTAYHMDVASYTMYGCTLYIVNLEGDDLKEVASGKPIHQLRVTPDGKTLLYLLGDKLFKYSVPNGPAAQVQYQARIPINPKEDWKQMLLEAHRKIKHEFYDRALHGVDWDQLVKSYLPLLKHVESLESFVNIIREFMGEMNASHLGALYRGTTATVHESTYYFGFEVIRDETQSYFRVGTIYEEGPADHDYVQIHEGDYILAVNGELLSTDEQWAEMMNTIQGKRAELRLNSGPNAQGAWTTRIQPITLGGMNWLRYQHWIKKNRAYVLEKSDGRIGYLHIRQMGYGPLYEFQRDLERHYHQDGLIIDVRYNPGGNIDQELLDILERQTYQYIQYRDFSKTLRPYKGYFGEKVVLINRFSGSDAEVFTQGFKDLQLGTVVGEPSAGAVIGTTFYQLIDGSAIGVPSYGFYTVDGVNLENNPVQPDIFVENMPGSVLEGVDAQLDAAINHILETLE